MIASDCSLAVFSVLLLLYSLTVQNLIVCDSADQAASSCLEQDRAANHLSVVVGDSAAAYHYTAHLTLWPWSELVVVVVVRGTRECG